jgi:gamma-glutamyltranspeptidase/glutathione hydrolase
MLKLLCLFICLCGCSSKQRYDYTQLKFTGGAVAADTKVASEAGVEILKRGGNAVDAAVATSFVLSVVRPDSCGIGGGGFMIIDSPNMDPVALNYRETAPSGVHPQFYKTHDSVRGPNASGVPGTVAGLLSAHERYGVLTRAQVLEPAIRVALKRRKESEVFTQWVNESWEVRIPTPEEIETLKEKDFGIYFLIKGFNQVEVLRLIAEHGKAGFYQGHVADAIVKATDGHITINDLASYSPLWEHPLQVDIGNGKTLIAMPPPSSGGVAIAQIIGILQRIAPASNFNIDVHYAHALVESMKHAFADRAEHMADAAFVDVPVDALLHPEYLDSLAETIDLQRTKDTYSYGSVTVPDDGGTSHFCVVDGDGMMVSATETINTVFGSKVIVTPYGFPLNNEMDDFSSPSGANVYGLRQSEKNLPEPGKRPLSSMSPTIIEQNGVPYLAIGGSGGPRIISAVVQVLLRILWFGDEPNEAVQRPRLHHQWLPNDVYFEEGNPMSSIAEQLSQKGHSWNTRKRIGVVQVILVEDGVMKPYSDRRKYGKPAGF